MSQPSVFISCSLGSIGGNETHVLTLCKYLRTHGVRVTVATRSRDFFRARGRELRSIGVQVISTPFGYDAPIIIKNIWAAISWPAASLGESFTHFVAIGPGGFHGILKRLLFSGVVGMYWEAGDGRRSRSPYHLWMLDSMDKLAATSRTVAARIEQLVEKNVGVLPPLTHIPEKRQVAPCWDEAQERISVAFVGRVCELKGIDTLIDIWPTLDIGRARLDVYGGGQALGEMRQRAREQGLLGSVHFHGSFDRTSELPSIMTRSNMLVLPSVTEGLPHVLIEAMAYGIPFVATDVGGISELAVDNPDVLVVEPRTEAIVWGIEEMVKWIRSGKVSPDRLVAYYSKHFSVDIVGERWFDFLEL